MNRRALWAWIAVVAAVVAGACGGESPSSPSANGTVAVQGVVLGEGASVTGSSGTRAPGAQSQKITVKVEGTSITVDVSANGTFEVKGIEAGTFTLVFLANGVEIGRVVVTAEPGSEVKVVVQVKDNTLVLIEIKVESTGTSPSPSPSPGSSPPPSACVVDDGTIGRGIELEGDVTSGTAASFDMTAAGVKGPVTVSASSAAYRCIGNAKADTDEACKASLGTGAKVHVRGTLMACSAAKADVTALEVKIQKPKS